jgi:hypothetical protein
MTAILIVNAKDNRQPTLEEVSLDLGVPLIHLDKTYGVHVIDPYAQIYAVQTTVDNYDTHLHAHKDESKHILR